MDNNSVPMTTHILKLCMKDGEEVQMSSSKS
jgi:hypothetical protein